MVMATLKESWESTADHQIEAHEQLNRGTLSSTTQSSFAPTEYFLLPRLLAFYGNVLQYLYNSTIVG